jgi:hypothetical protein
VADLVNSRRTAWLVLIGGLLVLTAIGLAYLPERRRMLVRWLVGVTIVTAIYMPLYWNGTGSIAQPARAIHSFISPNARDQSSDLYRQQENTNLTFNIKQGGLLGKGFGVPIDYALPIADIKSIDPLISYVPHDGVLYILMRMGVVGGIAFWLLLATGVIAGCRLARSSDRRFAAIGAVAACTLVGYSLQGYADQGFFFYRIALVIGSLLGMVEVARRLGSDDSAPQRSATDEPGWSPVVH